MDETISVTGMSCTGCEANVEEAIASIETVDSVDADHESNRVIVSGDVERSEITTAIENAGYTVEGVV